MEYVRTASEDINVYEEHKELQLQEQHLCLLYQHIERFRKWAFKFVFDPHLVTTLEHHRALGSED
jgi:hypothetical protein